MGDADRARGNAVYLVDDDVGVREELAEALTLRGCDVTTFASGEALLAVETYLVDGCIILDINMPGMNGREVHQRLRQTDSRHKVIVLTGQGTIAMAVDAVQTGAVDFLEKPFHVEALVQAIHRAQARLEQDGRERAKTAAACTLIERLSQREREVMDGLVLGLPNKIIAFRLGLSTRTVETYRAHVMEKLGVASVPEVVRLCADAGIAPTGAILRESGPAPS